MKTYLIVYERKSGDFTEDFLGKLSGKEAREKVDRISHTGLLPETKITWTPRVVKGVRFYIAVY